MRAIENVKKNNKEAIISIVTTIPENLNKTDKQTLRERLEYLKQITDTVVIIDEKKVLKLYQNGNKLLIEIISLFINSIITIGKIFYLCCFDFKWLYEAVQKKGFTTITTLRENIDNLNNIKRENILNTKLWNVSFKKIKTLHLDIQIGKRITFDEMIKMTEKIDELIEQKNKNTPINWKILMNSNIKKREFIVTSMITGVEPIWD